MPVVGSGVVVVIGSGGAWPVAMPVARIEGQDGAVDRTEGQARDVEVASLEHVERGAVGHLDILVARAGVAEVGAQRRSDTAPASRWRV